VLRAADASYMVASGSLPLGVPDDFYRHVAALAKSLGKRLVLDTSGAALKYAGAVYMLKPSLRELQDLVGREIGTESDQEQAAREVIAQGRSEIVVVSLGDEGALLATADGTRRFPAVPVEARGSIGAGDSMLAGIVLALTRGLPLHEAVRFGMAAGTAALAGFGTELCRRTDVESLYAQMSSEKSAPASAG
jgi:6-phosphofructokinase 2